jgi:hypothetical protein
MPLGVTKKASKGADGSAGNPGTAPRLPATISSLHTSYLTPRRDVGLELLDISEGEPSDRLSTDQRLDVDFDPSFIRVERRGFDRSGSDRRVAQRAPLRGTSRKSRQPSSQCARRAAWPMDPLL